MALEEEVEGLEKELLEVEQDLFNADEEKVHNTKLIIDAEDAIRKLRTLVNDLIERRIDFERIAGISEHSINISKDRFMEIDNTINTQRQQRQRFEYTFQALRQKLEDGPTTLDDYFNLFNQLEETQIQTYQNLTREFIEQQKSLKSNINSSTRQLSEAEGEASRLVEELEAARAHLDSTNDQYIDGRIRLALLNDRRERLRREIEQIKADRDRMTRDLKDAEAEALIKGQRIETGRTQDDVLNEIRKISGMLTGMRDVPDEAEDMYDNYNQTFREIQERIEQVRKNRRRLLEEIEERKRKWREVTEELLEEVNVRYKRLLSKLQASGEARLINPHAIEDAGLEIFVGFKGAAPQRLDPYTHSGGERSSSVMAFLLALQQNVLSPFRAVDEFDLHMDPRNKEVVSEFIVETMAGTDGQYMAITPSQITFRGKDVHIILVHKTENLSEARFVEEEQ
jgi:chromosome segregation protein